MHLIKNEKDYYLFDNNTVSVYKLNSDHGKKLESYSDFEIDRMIGNNLSNKMNCDYIEKKENKCNRADRIVLVISQACNLACKYCYAQEGSYGEENKCLMTFETLKQTMNKIIEIYPEGVSRIQYFGGEPLINFELMKKATPWIIDFFQNKGLELPSFTIVTNGTLITPEINEFFNRYSVNVTISIDGNKEVNDINRIFKKSEVGTYDTIAKNLRYISQNRNYILMLEMTVDKSNFVQFKDNNGKLLDIENLLEFKPDLFHIVPAIWPKGHKCNFESEENYELMKEYFISISKMAAKQFGSDKPFNVIKFADMAREIIKHKKRSILCGAGIDQFSVDVNGDMYPCFAFIGQSEYKMGNVIDKDITNFEKISQICKNNTFDSIAECQNCWAKGLCSNCIGNSYLVHGQINKPIKELCNVQKATLEQAIISCCNMVNR